jgi:putative endonuclease
MTQARIAFGKFGEDLASAELERRGYEVLERRYRRRNGEIDIIARDGRTMVFAEVKARESRRFGEASEAVTATKRHKLTQLALEYMARHGHIESPCRFDVVSIHLGPDGPEVEVIQNAF